MKDQIDRAVILLKAASDILKECDEWPYVKNALEVTAFYDDAECDGFCLMEDIDDFLEVYFVEAKGRQRA